MRSYLLFVAVVGITIPSGRCQLNLEGLTAGMPNSMAEMMQFQLLTSMMGGGSGSGGSGFASLLGAGAGGSGSSGGSNPLRDMMLYNAASGGGNNMGDMMPWVLFNSMSESGSSSTPTGTGPMGASPTPGMSSLGGLGNMASMFGFSGNNQNKQITPAQRDKITQAIIMSGKASSLSRVVNPDLTERLSLEREGLGINPMLQMMVCPRQQCSTPIGCESIESPYTAQTNYACRGCPRCKLDTTGGNMMRMMSMLGQPGGMMGLNPFLSMMAGGQGPTDATPTGPPMTLPSSAPAYPTGQPMPPMGHPAATEPASPVATPPRLPPGPPPAALMKAMAAMAQARAAAGATSGASRPPPEGPANANTESQPPPTRPQRPGPPKTRPPPPREP